MMSIHGLVWAFFRIANFVVLVLLFRHVFNAYFRRAFKEQIIKQIDFWLELRGCVLAARRACRNAQETIDADELKIKQLLENINRWHAWTVQRKAQRESDHALLLQAADERRKLQETHYEQTLLRRMIIPGAFDRARVCLQQEYEHDESKAHVFIERVLDQVVGHE